MVSKLARSVLAVIISTTLIIVGFSSPSRAAAIWPDPSEAITLSNGDRQQIVASADGQTVHALYRYSNDDFTGLRLRSSLDGGSTWGSTTTLSTAYYSTAKIATSSSGQKVVVVWNEHQSGTSSIKSRTSSNGGTTWSSVVVVASAAGDLYPGMAASDDLNTIHVMWEKESDSDYSVQVGTSTDSGATWGSVKNLSGMEQDFLDPSISTSGSGAKAVVSWSDQGTGKVRASVTQDTGSNWTSAQDIATGGSWSGNSNSSNMMSSDGEVIHVKVHQDSTLGVVSSTNGGSTWAALKEIYSGETYQSNLITSSDGTTLAATWLINEDSGISLYGSISTNSGSTWSTPAILSPATAGGGADDITIAMSTSGSSVSVGYYALSGEQTLYKVSTTTSAGSSWNTSTLANDVWVPHEGYWGSPQLVVSADGQHSTAAWQSWAGDEVLVKTLSTKEADAPAAPSITQVTAGDQQLSIVFTPGSDGGSPITSYQYQLNDGTWTTANQTSSPVTITGLTNGTQYTVRIRAVNLAGTGTASTSATGTPIGSAPKVTSVSPGTGPVSGGTTLTITGMNLQNTGWVKVGGVNANANARITSKSSTKVVAVTPPGSSYGRVAVVVGQNSSIYPSTAPLNFIYQRVAAKASYKAVIKKKRGRTISRQLRITIKSPRVVGGAQRVRIQWTTRSGKIRWRNFRVVNYAANKTTVVRLSPKLRNQANLRYRVCTVTSGKIAGSCGKVIRVR